MKVKCIDEIVRVIDNGNLVLLFHKGQVYEIVEINYNEFIRLNNSIYTPFMDDFQYNFIKIE